MKVLKKEMKLLGYRNKEIAKRLGVSKTTIHNWLTAVYTPSVEQIKTLKELGFSDTACLEPSKEVEA